MTPDQVLSLAEYQALAYAAIADIHARGRLPFLVGGTGQYIHAVIEGWRIPEVAPQPELRAELEVKARADGAEALHGWLAALDPTAAARIDYRNVRRVIRALEVCLVTGQPISELQRKNPPPYDIVQIGVTRPRPELYARIDARVDQMIEAGLVDEVRRLADAGYDWELPAMTGLGYRQIGEYLRGEVTLDEAIARIKKGTRRFVQQQYNWFRLEDPAIRWVDPGVAGIRSVDCDRAGRVHDCPATQGIPPAYFWIATGRQIPRPSASKEERMSRVKLLSLVTVVLLLAGCCAVPFGTQTHRLRSLCDQGFRPGRLHRGGRGQRVPGGDHPFRHIQRFRHGE